MSSSPSLYTCTKEFFDYPCCHRQWKHSGHCRFVHGYSRSFKFWFSATSLDEYGFVVDFSSLKLLEQKLKDHFDHTFLVNEDDPLMPQWKLLEDEGAIKLRVMINVGMESTSKLIWSWANEILHHRDQARTCCWRTQSSENEANSARYERIPDWYQFGK